MNTTDKCPNCGAEANEHRPRAWLCGTHHSFGDILHPLAEKIVSGLCLERADHAETKSARLKAEAELTETKIARDFADAADDLLLKNLDGARRELEEMEKRKDGAYIERNQCVALIARMAIALGWNACVTKTAIEGWSEDWHGCIYIELPAGQVSWHFHDSQAHLFSDIPRGSVKWDGHTTEEKYRRVGANLAEKSHAETRRKLEEVTKLAQSAVDTRDALLVCYDGEDEAERRAHSDAMDRLERCLKPNEGGAS
jgi:hypothetical protein